MSKLDGEVRTGHLPAGKRTLYEQGFTLPMIMACIARVCFLPRWRFDL